MKNHQCVKSLVIERDVVKVVIVEESGLLVKVQENQEVFQILRLIGIEIGKFIATIVSWKL